MDLESDNSQFQIDLVLVYVLAIALSLLLLTWIYEICVWIHHLYLRTPHGEEDIIESSTPPPLSEESKRQREEAIKQLLPPPEEYDDGNNSTVDVSCAICLEEFVSGELCSVLPLCRHIYHFECIRSWLLDELSCPICRCSVRETETA